MGAYIVADTGQTISVSGFIDSLGKVKEVPIVTAAVAYDDPTTYLTYVLFFHQVLYIERLGHHLLCPAQLRANQVTVDEVPLLRIPAEHRHPAGHSIITNHPHKFLHIPLHLQGTTSYFTVMRPTHEEVESDRDCIHIHMTSDQPWDPYDQSIHHAEESIRASLDQLPRERGRFVSSLRSTPEQHAIESLEAHSVSVVAALKSQPTLPIQVEADLLSEVIQSIATTTTLPLTKKG
jgi:hypothetical protein